jgi:16S rRNA (uracil1498-N3)-methyltransferase
MQLFFNSELNANTPEFSFSREESRHIMKVLRKSVGDTLSITNGYGTLFTAEITLITSNKCHAKITSKIQQTPKAYKLHLAVAPTKMNERYEWFLEKATEIGIDSITPIICDHSERKVIKHERFERILQAAMKQSLHCFLPQLHPAVSYKTFIQQEFKGERFIAHCDAQHKTALKQELQPHTEVTILIGPEGDFSTPEIEAALAKSFKPVSLGRTRLRTETAAIVACHSVAFTNEL